MKYTHRHYTVILFIVLLTGFPRVGAARQARSAGQPAQQSQMRVMSDFGAATLPGNSLQGPSYQSQPGQFQMKSVATTPQQQTANMPLRSQQMLPPTFTPTMVGQQQSDQSMVWTSPVAVTPYQPSSMPVFPIQPQFSGYYDPYMLPTLYPQEESYSIPSVIAQPVQPQQVVSAELLPIAPTQKTASQEQKTKTILRKGDSRTQSADSKTPENPVDSSTTALLLEEQRTILRELQQQQQHLLEERHALKARHKSHAMAMVMSLPVLAAMGWAFRHLGREIQAIRRGLRQRKHLKQHPVQKRLDTIVSENIIRKS